MFYLQIKIQLSLFFNNIYFQKLILITTNNQIWFM